MIGFAWNVGHGLTYKVLTDDTKRIICRSRLRLASDAENKVEDARRMQPRDTRFFLGTEHNMDNPTTKLPTLEAFDCPFVDLDDENAPASDKGAPNTGENRGANASSNRGATPVITDQDHKDGLLRPGFTEDDEIDNEFPHETHHPRPSH